MNVTRPNGRIYRPRKPPRGLPVVNYRDDVEWIYIIGTHDVERARSLAEQIATRDGYELDSTRAPERSWQRLAMRNGDQMYVPDEVHGAPTIIFKVVL
jgi:hypothetical protein